MILLGALLMILKVLWTWILNRVVGWGFYPNNLSKNSLGAIERGTSSPSIDTLDRIAAALEIELSELVKVKSVDL